MVRMMFVLQQYFSNPNQKPYWRNPLVTPLPVWRNWFRQVPPVPPVTPYAIRRECWARGRYIPDGHVGTHVPGIIPAGRFFADLPTSDLVGQDGLAVV